jgi:hypothetical protein
MTDWKIGDLVVDPGDTDERMLNEEDVWVVVGISDDELCAVQFKEPDWVRFNRFIAGWVQRPEDCEYYHPSRET